MSITQEQLKRHVKLHMNVYKYAPYYQNDNIIGFIPDNNQDTFLTIDQYIKLEQNQVLEYTPNMPWKGDFIIKKDLFTESDFTCLYDIILDSYDHEEIPTEIWVKLKENEEKNNK